MRPAKQRFRNRGEFKPGWVLSEGDSPARFEFEVLGPSIVIGGQDWTPILPDGDQEPVFCRTEAIAV